MILIYITCELKEQAEDIGRHLLNRKNVLVLYLRDFYFPDYQVIHYLLLEGKEERKRKEKGNEKQECEGNPENKKQVVERNKGKR